MFDYSIPNPLTDAGVKREIKERVAEIKSRPHYGTVEEITERILKDIAEWAYREGFKLGWRIHEVRSKSGKI